MILWKFVRPKYYLSIGPINVEEPDHVKLLGITIEIHLSFKKTIENLCGNKNYKLHALRRIKMYLTVEKVKLLGNVFIDCHFNCALLFACST